MSKTINLSLDTAKSDIQNPKILLRQGDGNYQTLRVTITSNGEPTDLTNADVIYLGTTSADHKIIDSNITKVDALNGVIDYQPPKQWGQDMGNFKNSYFEITTGDSTGSTASFKVAVLEAVDLNAEQAGDYITVVDGIVANVRKELSDQLADVKTKTDNATGLVKQTSDNLVAMVQNYNTDITNKYNDANNKANDINQKLNTSLFAKTDSENIFKNNQLMSKDLKVDGSIIMSTDEGIQWQSSVNNNGQLKLVQQVTDIGNAINSFAPISQEFDSFWGYSGSDLGYTYTPQATTIKLWAPTATSVDLLIYDSPNSDNVNRTYSMTRGTGFNQNDHSANTIGVWSVTLSGDYGKNIGTAYRYSLTFPDGHKTETQDPYTTAISYGGDKSIILDPNNEQTPNGFTANYAGRVNSPNKAIIGEMSIRDFTKSDTSGVDQNKRGKFLGACQPGTKNPNFGKPTGFDHVKSLGLNYIQVMPIFSTYSGDANSSDYSWGYDPKNYNAPTTGFATNPQDPRSAIYELKTMIKAYHDAGIGVTMDVVYNHVGGDAMQSPFEKAVPGYYFRKNSDGSLSNGSYCGNDFRSDSEMGRKLIIDSLTHWQSTFGIDGFRFDLLGVIDTTTSKQIEAVFAGKNILLYGEGWNMPTNLPENLKSMNDNSDQLQNFSFFSGTFRDRIIGKDNVPGFVSGNSGYSEAKIISGLFADDFSKISQNLQYVEVHDDRTLSDNNWYHNPSDDEATHGNRMALANAMVMLAQGMSLIQIGQEFWRNKQMNNNSYNAGDAINSLNWDYLQYHADTVQMMRDVIALKKNEKRLQLTNRGDLARFVSIDNEINGSKVISMTVQASDGGKKIILLNGSTSPVSIGSGSGGDGRLTSNYPNTNFDYTNYMISSPNVTKSNGAITVGAIGYVVAGFSE